MKFESIKRVYRVINLLHDSEAYSVYSCMCENKKIILYAIKDEQLKMNVAGYLIELENTNFDGILEIFSDSEYLFAAFNDIQLSCSLNDILSEEGLLFEDAIKFFYTALSAFCVHGVPAEIACDLVKHGNFGVGYDANPSCRYLLFEIENYRNYNLQKFGALLSKVIFKAFGDVINKKNFKKLHSYAVKLAQGKYRNMLEIYEGYRSIYFYYTELIKKGELTGRRDKSKLFKMISRSLKILRTVVVLVLIMVSIWLLYLSFRSDDLSGRGEIDRIGDVSIEEYIPEEE